MENDEDGYIDTDSDGYDEPLSLPSCNVHACRSHHLFSTSLEDLNHASTKPKHGRHAETEPQTIVWNCVGPEDLTWESRVSCSPDHDAASTKGDNLHVEECGLEPEDHVDYDITSEDSGLPHADASPVSTAIPFNVCSIPLSDKDPPWLNCISCETVRFPISLLLITLVWLSQQCWTLAHHLCSSGRKQ